MFFNRKNFSVKVTGRAGLIYKEGKKLVKIDSEMLTGPDFDIVVYKNSFKRWEPPFEGDIINDIEKDRIIGNVKSDLEENGYKVDIAN